MRNATVVWFTAAGLVWQLGTLLVAHRPSGRALTCRRTLEIKSAAAEGRVTHFGSDAARQAAGVNTAEVPP